MSEILKSKMNMIAKLFVYQVAMSLLGLFIVSPFSGVMQIAASIFATLFFFALVCYAVIEDGQKDYVSVNAGRSIGSPYTGFMYSFVIYIPTIVLVLLQMILLLTMGSGELSGITAILAIVIRFFLMGMYLGIESGLVNRQYDAIAERMVSNASESVQFFCDNYILFAILLVIFPVVCGITYMLAYKGKIHVNTEVKKKK